MFSRGTSLVSLQRMPRFLARRIWRFHLAKNFVNLETGGNGTENARESFPNTCTNQSAENSENSKSMIKWNGNFLYGMFGDLAIPQRFLSFLESSFANAIF